MSAAQLYLEALTTYKTGAYDTALDLLNQAISLAPKSPKLYDARASTHERLGNVQHALLDAREVVRLLPTCHKGYLRAAKMLTLANKWVNADKVLELGLVRVDKQEEKGRQELTNELDRVRELKTKAEHSPFSTLPLEIFLHIIHLATVPPANTSYTTTPTPLPSSSSSSKPKRLPTLFSAMRVSRTWYRSIASAPRLWETLKLDGGVNQRNGERKVAWGVKMAGGVEVVPDLTVQGKGAKKRRLTLEARGKGSSREEEGVAAAGRGKGIRRLILTATQDFPTPTYGAILSLLSSSGAASTLTEVVLSFVDGARTTISAEGEGIRATQLLTLLHSHCGQSLVRLSICTGGRVYPDFDLTSVYVEFPRLRELRICGTTTSNFVFGLRAPFLKHGAVSSAADSSVNPDPPFPLTKAEHLTVLGAVLTSETPLSLTSYPSLKTLSLDVLNAPLIWSLLSAPNLEEWHAVVYGETHVVELPMPDLERTWGKVESLRIGGAKRLAPRLLDQAVKMGLFFPFLRELDLSFAALSTCHLFTLFSTSTAPHLTTLNLASTTVSPPSRTLSLPSRLDALKQLNVSHTLWTTDQTLRDLARCAPGLERLEVRGNAFITGRPVMELVRARMPSPPPSEGEDPGGHEAKQYSLLTHLALEGCTKIETAAVEWLRVNMRPGGVKFQFVESLGGERRRGGGAGRDWQLG